MSDYCVSGNQIMENERIRDFHKCQNWQYCHPQWDKIRCNLNTLHTEPFGHRLQVKDF